MSELDKHISCLGILFVIGIIAICVLIFTFIFVAFK